MFRPFAQCVTDGLTYDATKIACLECKFEEAFGISSDNPSASVKALKSDQMVIVLQRWQFAG